MEKPNHKSFLMVSDMMDFRSYNTSSSKVIVKLEPKYAIKSKIKNLIV
jgi:hypothetical protein